MQGRRPQQMVFNGSLPLFILLVKEGHPVPPDHMKESSLFKRVNFKASGIFLLLNIEFSDSGFPNFDAQNV